MRVIIVGCGRLGSELAGRLFYRGHEVSVIDTVAASFNALPHDFHGRLNEGDVLNQDVLLRAGIRNADALASVTSSDALNLVVGRIATEMYHIPNVVVRNYGPNCRQLFETFGLQVVSSTSWGAQRVEEMLSHSELRTVFSAGNGEVEIYELPIPEDWEGRTLGEVVNDQSTAVAITRAGRAALPSSSFRLENGDLVHISATYEGIEEIRSRVCRRREEH